MELFFFLLWGLLALLGIGVAILCGEKAVRFALYLIGAAFIALMFDPQIHWRVYRYQLFFRPPWNQTISVYSNYAHEPSPDFPIICPPVDYSGEWRHWTKMGHTAVRWKFDQGRLLERIDYDYDRRPYEKITWDGVNSVYTEYSETGEIKFQKSNKSDWLNLRNLGLPVAETCR